MHGIAGLADAIQSGVKRKAKQQEAKAQRGIIQNGMVRIGGRSYPFKTVIDCSTEDGSFVWVQLTQNGTAVIIGA